MLASERRRPKPPCGTQVGGGGGSPAVVAPKVGPVTGQCQMTQRVGGVHAPAGTCSGGGGGTQHTRSVQRRQGG